MGALAHRALRGAMAACLLASAAGPTGAQTADLLKREIAAVGVIERLGAAIPREASFAEAEGRPLALSALAGRPILLSFNYTSCPRLCGLQLAGLARALKGLGWKGERFSVATVSIDPAEKLPQLLRYKQGMVREAGGGEGAGRAWHFLAGSKEDIDALAGSVGFKYRYAARTGEFAHQATLVVLTGDGRVSGYLHGISYAPAALRVALDRAAGGQVASAVDQKSLGGYLLTCMGFDPADRTPLALKAMRTGGALALLFLVSFLGFQFLRDARRRGSRPAP